MKYIIVFLLFVSGYQGWLLYGYINVSFETESIDTNSDGSNDLFFEYKSDYDTILSDRNRDGEIDQITTLDLDGLVMKTFKDDDFDKVFESTSYFKEGIVIRTEIDLGQDSEIDYIFSYKDGVIYEAVKSEWGDVDGVRLPINSITYSFNLGFPTLDADKKWTPQVMPKN